MTPQIDMNKMIKYKTLYIMDNKTSNMQRIVIFLTIMTIALVSTQAGAVFATPPTITPQLIANIPFATPDNTLRSNRLEFMQVLYTASSNTTDLNLKYFNRTDANKFKTASLLNIAGNWAMIARSEQSLGCVAFTEATTTDITMVRFDTRNLTLTRVLTITEAEIRAQLPVGTNTLPATQLYQLMILGESCNLVGIASRIYQTNANNTLSLVATTSAANWLIQAKSISLKYVIANNKLYRHNMATNLYDQIFSNPQSFMGYTIKNFDNRIIIQGLTYVQSNISVTAEVNGANVTSTVQLFVDTTKIFILLDAPTGLTLVDSFTTRGLNPAFAGHVIITSARLTKLAFRYLRFINGQASQSLAGAIVIKSIDYTNMKVLNVTFGDAPRFLAIMEGIGSMNDVFLGDFFFIVRNQRMCIADPSKVCNEVCHQFVGDKLNEIGRRILGGPGQMGAFQRVFIDESFISNAIALSVSKQTDQFRVDEINYFNFAATRRIVPPTVPEFLDIFLRDSILFTFDGPNLQLSSVDTDPATNVTAIRSYRFTDQFNTTSNVVTTDAMLPGGPYFRIASQKRCGLYGNFLGAVPVIILHQKVPNQSGFVQTPLIAPELPALGELNANTFIQIGANCQRIAINKTIFYRVNATVWLVAQNNYTTFVWNSMDENLTYAVIGNSVWKYDPALFKYAVYYNSPTPFHPMTKTASFGNRLCIATHDSNAQRTLVAAFAFLDTPTGLSRAFTFNGTFAGPLYVVEVSDNLELVIVAGLIVPTAVGVSPFKIEIFSLNYQSLSSMPLTFPTSAIRGMQVPNLILFDRFIYIRQIRDAAQAASNNTYAAIPHQEFVYLYDGTNVPKLIFNRKLTDTDALNWKRTMFKKYANRTFLLQGSSEVATVNTVLGNKLRLESIQLAVERATINIQGGFVQNGKVKACIIGCTACTLETECTECGQMGFVLNTVTKRCVQCAPGCSTCEQNDPNTCLTCFNGTYLSTTASCVPCRAPCLTCDSTTCLSCIPGKKYDSVNNVCQSCSLRNCLVCNTLSTCAICQPGFVLANSKCRGCALSCSQCDPTNITLCTGCKSGLQLVSGKCVSCPSKCLVCNDQLACQNCSAGYYAKEGLCVLNCQIPCATCVDNMPGSCLSCFGTATLVGTTCQFDSSCNATASCTSCGESQGSNLYLESGNCYSCSKIAVIANCLQCSTQNPLVCSVCSKGFYLSSGACVACSAICRVCTSQVVCSACVAGYTLPDGASSGQCIACVSPCATCESTQCLTCVEGFTKQTWKCQKNNFVEFRLTFRTASVSTVLTGIDAIIASLLGFINENADNTDAITVYAVTTGSSVLTGSATSSTGTSTSTSTALAAGLTSGVAVGGESVLSSSVAVVDLSSSSSSTSQSRVGLIVGVVIGSIVFIGIVIGLLVYFCYIKKRAFNQVDDLKNGSLVIPNEKIVIEMDSINNV